MSGLKLWKLFNQESWGISQGFPSKTNSSLTGCVSFFFLQRRCRYSTSGKLCHYSWKAKQTAGDKRGKLCIKRLIEWQTFNCKTHRDREHLGLKLSGWIANYCFAVNNVTPSAYFIQPVSHGRMKDGWWTSPWDNFGLFFEHLIFLFRWATEATWKKLCQIACYENAKRNLSYSVLITLA